MTHDQLWDTVHRYGYPAIFALVFAENLGLPVPGDTIFLVSILMVAHGKLHWAAMGLCAWGAATLGGMAGFAVGRYGGRRLLEKYGAYAGIHSDRLADADRFFAKHGVAVVLVARFVYGLREVCSIIAGCISMTWRRFLAYNAAGAALWAGFWTAMAVWFAPSLRRIWDTAARYEPLILVAVVALCLAGAIVYVWGRGDPRA